MKEIHARGMDAILGEAVKLARCVNDPRLVGLEIVEYKLS